ncbi:heterokaryon incompatibility protein Het-C-domain-containing protein [Triangularia setosa]|uniref:Heterokaryon incompatibility protein Het-C-domain-containing protein n=1 Tax=Triangularia setosa TaxID=2587417 RepID=A0AAN6WGQ1_9PEZI|nr:heterokaryon incompatibility protein Het-C-domain-containing protein [Podospora setosa]
MAYSREYPTILLGVILLFWFVKPTLAFGAGNIAGISSIEGQNWRHGDIEDALLKVMMARAVGGKRFDKLMVSRVYFGNWLRDYSQAIDVGTVKSVSAEAIRLLLCVLGFITFGYGSKEFEVTAERLGCYRPEDHIDNPKDYAENEDARQYHRALRGPINEEVELAIDPETGMKNYIANENIGIMTSAAHCRKLFTDAINLGRSYGRSGNKDELYECLRLIGTGLHCLEDYFAHSNYVELALVEMGEQDIFPHVGRNTKISIEGANDEVYPIVTGTFGGVDFLHSVTGEVSDKLIQSEIEDLENTLQQSKNSDLSVLRELLDKIPDGLIGGDKKNKVNEIQDNANAAQMEQTSISPKETEEFTQQVQDIFRQIMPAIEYHDDLLKSISEAVSRIPILPKIIEQLEEQLSLFVFQVIAPFVIPVIEQIKNELATGATEIIESSKNEQHIVFENDHASDPTHSMLSKDHFTNILNEVAGRAASKVVSWSVPQLMEAIDDDNVDINRTLNKIIYGVLHHPAQRRMGPDGAEEGRKLIFGIVEEWWGQMSSRQQDEYRQKLSREGVENGENHKEGQQDCGHGCGGKLKIKKNYANAAPETMEDRIAQAAAGHIVAGVKQSFKQAAENAGGGENSGGLGGFLSSVAGNIFNSAQREWGQEEQQREETPSYGGGYRRQEEEETPSYGGGGYRRQEEETPSYGGGYGRREEESSGGYGEAASYGGGYGRRREEEEERPSYGGGGGGYGEAASYGGGYGRREEESSGYGGGYGRREEESSGYGRREEGEAASYGRGDYGEAASYGGGGGYGRRRNDEEEEEEEGRRRW